VNIPEGLIDLELKDTKTSEPRRVYFNDFLGDIFRKEHKAKNLRSDLVCTRRGQPIGSIRKGLEHALEWADIKGVLFTT